MARGLESMRRVHLEACTFARVSRVDLMRVLPMVVGGDEAGL